MGVDYYKTFDLHPFDITGILRRETVLDCQAARDTVGLPCILQREFFFWAVINNQPLRRRAIPTDLLTMYRGESRRLRFFVIDSTGAAVNVKGALCVFTFRRGRTGPILFTKSTAVAGEGEIGAADRGEVFFWLVPTDTQNLDVESQYVADMTVTLSGGDGPYTAEESIVDLFARVR